ncbi:MAG: hypothetical protein E5Y02_10355 [Mesorhizobium sp.]|nr:MAG: hypothetical protein E5Y02_10355 [Mesorhizobium sp.]
MNIQRKRLVIHDLRELRSAPRDVSTGPQTPPPLPVFATDADRRVAAAQISAERRERVTAICEANRVRNQQAVPLSQLAPGQASNQLPDLEKDLVNLGLAESRNQAARTVKAWRITAGHALTDAQITEIRGYIEDIRAVLVEG